jgi:hypothetical protein
LDFLVNFLVFHACEQTGLILENQLSDRSRHSLQILRAERHDAIESRIQLAIETGFLLDSFFAQTFEFFTFKFEFIKL